MIRRDFVRAYKEGGLTHAEIAQRLHCSERQIDRLVADEKAKGWEPKQFKDLVVQDVEAAKKSLVERIVQVDSMIVESVADQVASGDLLPDARDYHQVSRRHVGNKQVQENVLKIDPSTLAALGKIIQETDSRIPRLPPPEITHEFIDEPNEPTTKA